MWVRCEFGYVMGEEYTDADPSDPHEGVYVPVWMPINELPEHTDVHPANISKMVVKAQTEGWPDEPVEIWEKE